ncbi:MAG: hypothetical protein U9Q84_08485 [Thermodesulfobacteriota bacterium]|nr:hypothetical protein [Thermodesulfobacteriota bacterium]
MADPQITQITRIKETDDQKTYKIIVDAAFQAHKRLEPRLLINFEAELICDSIS